MNIDKAFSTLGRRIGHMPLPVRPAAAPESLASLIDKVNAAKRRYRPGIPR